MTPLFRMLIATLILPTLVISCTLAVSSAHADSIYIGQISDHFNSDTEYREIHPLVVYAVEDQEGAWIAGWWRNSYNRDTFAFGVKTIGHKGRWGEVGYKAGLASGYRAPVFATLYYQNEHIDINWLPGEMVSGGLRFHF